MINENNILKYEDCKTEIDLVYDNKEFINKFYKTMVGDYIHKFFNSLYRCHNLSEVGKFIEVIKELMLIDYNYYMVYLMIIQGMPIIKLRSINDLGYDKFLYIMFGVE